MTIQFSGVSLSGVSITSNAASSLLLDLESDTLALSDGSPVSTWLDQSNNHNDFSQSGAARPTKQTNAGFPTVVMDGVGNWILGSNFADNLDSFTVLSVIDAPSGGPIIGKLGNDTCSDPGSQGWIVYPNVIQITQNSTSGFYQNSPSTPIRRTVVAHELISKTELHLYYDGGLVDQQPNGGTAFGSGVTSFSNSEPVRIGVDGALGACDNFLNDNIYAIRIHSPALSPANLAAEISELATRYGITLDPIGNILRSRCTAYFTMNDGAGLTRVDSTGRGNNLSDNSTVGSVSGKVSNAASFSNSSQNYLSHVDTTDLSISSTNKAIAFWVYLPDLMYKAIVSKWNFPGSDRNYLIDYDDFAGRFNFYCRKADDSGNVVATSNTFGAPSPNAWYFIVAQYDADNSRIGISVNGGAFDYAALSGGVRESGVEFDVGSSSYNLSTTMNGYIDEMGVYNGILLDTYISYLYNGGSGISLY